MNTTNSTKEKTIDKFWISKDGGTDTIILVANKMIYKSNRRPQDLEKSISHVYKDKIPKDLFSLPFSYINKIQMQEGKNFIGISFKQESNEHLRIEDEYKKKEIFEYFKENIDGIRYKFVEYSMFKTIKKPLIALVVLTLLSAWAYAVAHMLENGEDTGTQLIIVYFLAGFGTKLLSFIYAGIFLICSISMVLKLKNPPKVHELKLK